MNKLLTLILLLFLTLSITANEKYIIDENTKRHFIDFSFLSGGSFSQFDLINSTGTFRTIDNTYGGLFGLNFGFQYAFTRYFGFGPGISGFFALANTELTFYPFWDEDKDRVEKHNYINGLLSGGCIMLNFMFGDLLDKKIAFLLDLGGGWLFCSKIGIYIKGFTLKFGYQMTSKNIYDFIPGHNIFIDVGFKLNAKIII